MAEGCRPAVFLDRDNTLIDDPGYLRETDQVHLRPGAAAAVAQLRSSGYPAVVVTNQSGIARGMLTEDDLDAIHRRMRDLLRAEDADVDAIYYCPFLSGPDAVVDRYRRESDLRKPRPGMLLTAADEMNIDLSSSWMIGDSARDIQAGREAGCRTILIGNESADADARPDYVAPDLSAAVEFILAESDTDTRQDISHTPEPNGMTPGLESQQPDVTESIEAETRVDSHPNDLPDSLPPVEPSCPPSMNLQSRARSDGGDNENLHNDHSLAPRVHRTRLHTEPANTAKTEIRDESLKDHQPETHQGESLLAEILEEIRTLKREQRFADFSLSQLAGSIAQAFALCAIGWGLYAAINEEIAAAQIRLLTGIAFQLIALTGFLSGKRK